MQLLGQLKDDVLNSKAVLFLGAGASQAAGLFGGEGLANYLFEKAENIATYADFKRDLPRLVAKLDKDPSLTRRWVNNQLIQYFMDNKNYTNLDAHKKIFQLGWKAIFTTNYDQCMEFAEHTVETKRYRLLPVVDSKDSASIFSTDEGKLKYFKIHGCCRELEQHHDSSLPLVITRSDFRESIARNKPFLEELARYAYDCSIIFIGFQAHRAENNPILASVIETYNNIASFFHQPFKGFVVLKDVNPTDRSDIEEAGLNLIEGTFQAFMESVVALQKEHKRPLGVTDIERKIWIKAAGKEAGLTIAEHKQFCSQFISYYEGYLEDEAQKLEGIPHKKLVDLWKTHPTDMILSKGYYVKRTIFDNVAKQLKNAIAKVARTKSPELLVITGKRASGKSALARQLMAYTYSELRQPALILSHHASYLEKPNGSEKVISISGWDGRQIDKFLSLFSHDNEDGRLKTIPVILADHLFNRLGALDHLLSYLENHGKPCVLILTLNQDQYEEARVSDAVDRLLQLYKYYPISIFHKLDDQEIGDLFKVVSRLEPRVRDKRDLLIDRAKQFNECNRDILLILYTWFDKRFRRLDEIISEEIEKLNRTPELKNFYLSVAVFHQYNFSPRIPLCAEALGVSMDVFSDLRSQPAFKALIDIDSNLRESGVELVATRHSEFSRRILNELVPNIDTQVDLMCRILSQCSLADLQFTRDFLNYICRYKALLAVDQVTRIKEATEKRLSEDYVLNHQFGAYLIRETTKLDDARYYLDLALQENSDNSSIIHSLGNLYYKLYKNTIDSDPQKAMEYYDRAKEYFARSRTLTNIRDEYAYFTDITMMRYRINSSSDDKTTNALLKAEKYALTFEALRVVPSERQNLLRDLIGQEVPFKEMSVKDQELITTEIMDRKASPLLLEYYAQGLLSYPNTKNWQQLSKLVSLYLESAKRDPATAIVLCLITKRAFIKNSETRFELLRSFFDRLIRYQETKINFALLAEYVRLIQIDALVLGKYDFLRTTTGDIIDTFRESKPRFLQDEFVLDRNYYCFDEDDMKLLLTYFKEKIDFSLSKVGQRYQSIVDLDHYEGLRFFNIELDPISRYYIKGVRKEVATRGKVELNFCIKHTYDGFFATGFRT